MYWGVCCYEVFSYSYGVETPVHLSAECALGPLVGGIGVCAGYLRRRRVMGAMLMYLGIFLGCILVCININNVG